MNWRKLVLATVMVAVMAGGSTVGAMATPHFTLIPTTGSQTVGTNFVVTLGVDSDTEKVVGIDIKANFDSSKLEVVSIEKGTIPDDGYKFSFTPSQAIINNDTGSFEMTLTPNDTNVLTGPIAKHELLKVTFRPKATGTATLSYVCTAGSVVETNIISQAGVDVVDCAANQSGSYTIATGTGGDPATTVATSTPVPASTTELPQTGSTENTIMLLIFGLSTMAAAWYLRMI